MTMGRLYLLRKVVVQVALLPLEIRRKTKCARSGVSAGMRIATTYS